MYQYFAFNILYSFIVFMYLHSLKTAPFRVRFRFVLLAMVSWLVPYDLFNNFLVQDNAQVFSKTLSNINIGIRQVIVSQINNETYLTLLNFIAAMTFIGFIWFMKDVVSLKIKLQKLNIETSLYKTINGSEIYKTNNQEIFTVGFIKPKIVIAEKYLNSPFADSIIKHELQHIRSNDQLWLLLITFVQRLLWWNPIVYLLAHKGRELIELSCDQACKEQSRDNQYQKDLAQILVYTNQESNPLASHFFGKSQLNIFRIKQLSKEFKMNKKHKALIFSTALIPFVLMLFVSTASVSSEKMKIKGDSEEVVLAKNEIDFAFKTSFIKHKRSSTAIVSTTKLFESRGIQKYGEVYKNIQGFNIVGEEKIFKVNATPKYVDNENVLIEFEIIYISPNGKQITKTPSIMVLNGTRAVIDLVYDATDDYKIEIEVLPRF